MSSHVARQFFACGPKDRIRIVLDWEEKLRPIFWFSLAVDGGVYAGPRGTGPMQGLRHGRGDPGESGQVIIKYDDGEELPGSVNPSLSFHPSGVFHLPGSRLFTQPLASSQRPRLLCHVAFQHPRCFATIRLDQFRNQDILIQLESNETRPLLGWLHLLPTISQLVEPDCLEHQIDLVFHCSGFQSGREFFLAFAIGPGRQAPWPPRTFLFVPEENS